MQGTRITTRFYKFHIEIYNDFCHFCQRGRESIKEPIKENIKVVDDKDEYNHRILCKGRVDINVKLK